MKRAAIILSLIATALEVADTVRKIRKELA